MQHAGKNSHEVERHPCSPKGVHALPWTESVQERAVRYQWPMFNFCEVGLDEGGVVETYLNLNRHISQSSK